MTEYKGNSLQRCIAILKFMGFYLELNNSKTSSDSKSCSNLQTSNFAPEWQRVAPVNRSTGWISYEDKSSYSKLNIIAKVAWYALMNVLYLILCFYLFYTRDYSQFNLTRLLLNGWSILPAAMVIFCMLKCLLCQRSFARLFATMAHVDSSNLQQYRFLSAFDTGLIFCLAFTRLFLIYGTARKTHEIEKDKKAKDLQISDIAVSYVFWCFIFSLILSFNFLVGLLTKFFKQKTASLEDIIMFSAKLSKEAAGNYSQDAYSHSGKKFNCYVPPNFPTETLLRDIEEQLLLVDTGIEQITAVFSWILIFFTCWLICDLVFGLYLLVTSLLSGESEIYIDAIFAIEAICFLLLIHNPADALSEAEEKFRLKMRMFIYCLGDKFPSEKPGLFLALQRPRKLTLGNFGDIGRSSFINTLAFMLSYVVVTIQFAVTAPPTSPVPGLPAATTAKAL